MTLARFFKLFILFLLIAGTGCIDADISKNNSVSNSNPETLPAVQVEDTSNTYFPNNTENEEIEVLKSEVNKENTDYSPQNIPEVPTFKEEKVNIIYQKEYRLLSLNFQRAIGSGDEKIASEIFNITGKTSGYNIKDACEVFDYVNRHWQYRYDKNAEFFFGAGQTINEGYNGDCDDYSIVMSALMKYMGFNTRIVTGKIGNYGHAYPELYIGNDQETAYEILSYIKERYSYAENIWYSSRNLEEGEVQYWLNFDWSGSNGYRHPGGEYFEAVEAIYYPNGLIEF